MGHRGRWNVNLKNTLFGPTSFPDLDNGAFVPSPDGKFVAYELYEGGKEIGKTRVTEIATGKGLGIHIDNGAAPKAGYPTARASRTDALKDSLKPEERHHKQRIRLHRLAKPAADPSGRFDRALFGYRVNATLEFLLVNRYAMTIPLGSTWAFDWVNPGPTNNYALYFTPVDALTKSSPLPWRKLAELTDEIVPNAFNELALTVRGDELYVITTKNEPLGKVIRLNLKDPNLVKAQPIFSGCLSLV